VELMARGLEQRLGEASLRLIIEPGRALVGNAGALITRVLYVKRNQTKNFVVVDAGMNDLMRPTLYGSYHEIVPARGGTAERLLADIVGPLCESGDFFARDRDMPDVQPGDLLAVLTTGAYGFVLSSNYNTRPRPAEVLVHGAEAELIRERETVEGLMAGERI
jgi:diaminopimelate decarboxylase